MNPAGDAAAVEEEALGWALSPSATVRECGRLRGSEEVGVGGEGWLTMEVAGAA